MKAFLNNNWQQLALLGGLILLCAFMAMVIPANAQSNDQAPSRQRLLLLDPHHPDILILCPGVQKDADLRISAADAGNCSIILPPPKPSGFTCHAVVDAKGRAPISFSCIQDPTKGE